jgi:hypothetical protein
MAAAIPNHLRVAISAFVRLTVNLVPEMNLFNGSRGTVIDWIYSEGTSPREGDLPAILIVDFPAYTGPALMAQYPFAQRTWIPLAPMQLKCDTYCCHREGFPIAIAKACTINRMQGLEVGPNKQMEKLIGHLSAKDEKVNPGSRNVLHSRCSELGALALAKGLTSADMRVIGFGPRCDARAAELARVRTLAISTLAKYKRLDPRFGSAEFYIEQLKWLTQFCLTAYQDSVAANAVAVCAKCMAINAEISVAMQR